MLRDIAGMLRAKISGITPERGSATTKIAVSTAVLCIAIFLVVILTVNSKAFSQQQGASKFDFEQRRRDILAHLNAVIQFYRSSTTPIQKIGEPNDVLYRDQAVSLATQVTQLSFQSAKAEADLMSQYERHEGKTQQPAGPAEQQRLQAVETNVEQGISDLKTRAAELDKKIASANSRNRPVLEEKRKQIQGALDLGNAMKDALGKIVGMSSAQGSAGFAGDVDGLQRSIPQIGSKTASVAAELTPLDQARSSGVSSQTMALFSLLVTKHAIGALLASNEDLHKQTEALRAPVSEIVRGLAARGQQLSRETIATTADTPGDTSAQSAPSSADTLESIAATFKAVSSASVPLTEEIIVLEQSRANLEAWNTAVNREYKSILQALLMRLIVIVIALGLIFGAGELWTRATNRYIRDGRRRRQLLLMRRTAVGFLSVIVLLFGFVTQFDSLATFAGFITAGIAVGLQTILLSVAAYFFIIGRYGIKVGDRITITTSTGAGVTGEVIEVGLVRFYMMELAGKGVELNPTGRVVVFTNAILFQAGAPLYKQIPGTEYAWHELVVDLAPTADHQMVSEAILKVLHSIYGEYREGIELQHSNVTQRAHAPAAMPAIQSRVQFDSGALQFWARFPVQIKNAAETDERLTEALLQLFAENASVKEAVTSLPILQPSVKG